MHSKDPIHRTLLVTALALVAASCNEWPAQATAGFRILSVEVVASGLDNPVQVAAPPGDSRLFVAERSGVVRLIQNGRAEATPFIDLTADVSTFGNERGLLSIAFHPQYAQNRRFFVSYTGNDGALHVVRYESSSNPAVANPASRKELLAIPTPGVQHYGGMMGFTPEGALLVSIGEGGTFTEPGGESQNPGSLLGKLLRLNVDSGDPYSIPSDNPYVDRANWRPEIWAMGLRNPWRFSIDPATRQLFLADVGDRAYEEVNIVSIDEPGLNYGWNYYEGTNCQFTADLCASAEFHTPEVAYSHQPPCTSVTGGIVYRGTANPEHQGRYFYADYCLGWIRSFRYEAGHVAEELDWATSIASDHIVSFGEDGAGELYAVSLSGRVYRIGAERAAQQ